MKKNILYMAMAVMGAAAFCACDDDKALPTLDDYEATIVPTIQANTTLMELKEKFYTADKTDYANLIGLREDGERYIIEGVITSNVASGNVYNQVFVQDAETGLLISVKSSYLDTNGYKTGQRVVIDCTGFYLGAYGKGLQMGTINDASSAYPSRIPQTLWEDRCQKWGLPQASYVDTVDVTIGELNAAAVGSKAWMQWQGRLVRITGVKFKTPGEPLGINGNSNNTQYIVDATTGAQTAINTSGYSTIYSYLCPEGEGDVIGLLTWFTNASGSTNTWQVKLIDLNGLVGFIPIKEPEPQELIPEGEGTLESPYSPSQAYRLVQDGAAPSGKVYVEGYVVGTPSIDTNYGNAVYYISDDGTRDNRLYVYRGYGLNGAKFTTTDGIKPGEKLVIYGELTTYSGTPQIGTGSQIVSITPAPGAEIPAE